MSARMQLQVRLNDQNSMKDIITLDFTLGKHEKEDLRLGTWKIFPRSLAGDGNSKKAALATWQPKPM